MKNTARAIAITAALFVAILVFALMATSYLAQKQQHRGMALDDLVELFQPGTEKLGKVILENYREFRGNTIRWSAAYFGCLFGSALLSAMAALCLKLELLSGWPKLKSDLAASLAIVAALLITLSTTGDFQGKWQANRLAAAEMENLAYELARSSAPANVDAILDRIQRINEMRHRGIMGEFFESGSREPLMMAEPPRRDDASDGSASQTPRP